MTPAAFNTAMGALTIDSTGYYALAAIIVTALLGFWIVKKIKGEAAGK